MNEAIDDSARRAWQQPSESVDASAIGAAIARRLADRRRRAVSFWASFAIITPSWIAALWLLPDLRMLAAIGLAVSAWLGSQMYRRSRALGSRLGAAMPCATHERELLARERGFYQSLPRWFIGPVIVVQVAIVVTLLTNPRFERTTMFPVSLTALVLTAATVLGIAFRRSRRMVARIDRELALLREGVEA